MQKKSNSHVTKWIKNNFYSDLVELQKKNRKEK